MNKPSFEGGTNIAIKIPKVRFEETIRFYRDILGLPLQEEKDQLTGKSYSCPYGPNRLWFDCIENYSQSEVWLELQTPNLKQAEQYLEKQSVPLQDELEPLPQDLNGHWISSPAGTVHLLFEKP